MRLTATGVALTHEDGALSVVTGAVRSTLRVADFTGVSTLPARSTDQNSTVNVPSSATKTGGV